MKTTLILFLSALAILPLRAGDKLPADVQRLLEARDREVKRINDRFVRDLEEVRNRYERSGNVEIVKRIDNLFGTGKFVLEGKWQMYNRGQKENGLREFRDGVMHFNGKEFPVSVHGQVIRITWGRHFEVLAVSEDPRVMLGTNKVHQHLRMVKTD